MSMKIRLDQILFSIVMAVAIVAAGAVVAQDEAGGVELHVAEDEQHGQFLTDAEGNALYVFVQNEAQSLDDRMTEGVRENVAECTGGCLDAWPPFVSDGEVSVAEEADLASEYLYTAMIGEYNQVVYNGYPLYTFANDSEPGDTNGQGIQSNGAIWYLIGPDGTPVDASDEAQEAG